MTEAKTAGSNLARHGLMMAAGSLVSRISGFGRTVVIALALGDTILGNAFTTAQYFPQMVYELVLGGVLTSVLIPLIVRARKNDDDRGEAFAQRLVTLCMVLLLAATAALIAAAPLLARLAGGEGNRELVTQLSYFMLPAIFFYGLCALMQAVLNTRDRFAAPMWAPIVNNLVIIVVGVLFFAFFTSADDTFAAEDVTLGMTLLLGFGTLAGIVFQALTLLPSMRAAGWRWRLRFDFRNLPLGRIARLGGWMYVYVGVNLISTMVLLKAANLAADAGGPEARFGPIVYNNAYLIMMMAYGIVSVSITTALMPRLSSAAADERHEDLKDDLSLSLRTSTLLLAPIGACYVVLGQPLAVLLFDGGAYSHAAAVTTGLTIAAAGLALIPFSISQAQIFAFYALTDSRTVALIGLPTGVLRVVGSMLALWLLPPEYVVVGIMIGMGSSYVLSAALSQIFLRRRLGPLGMRRILSTWLRQFGAVVPAGVAAFALLPLLPGLDDGRVPQAATVVVGGLALLAVYFVLAWLLKVHEVKQAVRMVRAKLGR